MKTLFTLQLLFISLGVRAQMTPSVNNLLHAENEKASKDTTIESDTTKENKEPQYFYLTAGA